MNFSYIYTVYWCIANKIGMELHLAVGEFDFVLPNFNPQTIKTLLLLCCTVTKNFKSVNIIFQAISPNMFTAQPYGYNHW